MKNSFVFLLIACFLSLPQTILGQSEKDPGTEQKKTRKFDILPAISYSPETKLTLGVIGYYYLDLTVDDPVTRTSNINFLAVYTTAKQILLESKYEIFTNANAWIYKGEIFYNKYPDRNYGIGNAASALIVEIDENEESETFNYLAFNSNRLRVGPAVLRRIGKNLYAGAQWDFEHLWGMEAIPDKYVFANADSSHITHLPVEGTRSGLGAQLLFDNRDNILNPLNGNYIELSGTWFMEWIGSDYNYSSYRLDARKYLNPVSNHTFALRAVLNNRFSADPIPLRGLSRVGGKDFIRGYFKGTYQDNHLMAFEAEYRLPLWKEGTDAKLWQLWRRLGVVAFISGAQTYHEFDELAFDRFNLAAGGGLRILFNKESRINIRIDYAFGLSPNSAGPGQRQSGLYFFLAEAF